jgi:hypothetical protein
MNAELPVDPTDTDDAAKDDETLLDSRGIIQRHWVSRDQWETLQINCLALRQNVITFGGAMIVMAGCCLFIPAGHFWAGTGCVAVLETFLAFHVGRMGLFLHRAWRELRSLRQEELTVLTSDVRTQCPGLMRTLQAWALSDIPLTLQDEKVLREAMTYMADNADSLTPEGYGFGVGQRADDTQTEPYSANDALLMMPWETSVSQATVLAG